MMKNFTKILGLLALAAPLSVSADEWEWREVSKTDFGGNEESADNICKTEPSRNEYETELDFYDWASPYEAGKYVVIKATQLADVGRGCNLTNWGTVYPGSPTWISGGDHTNPDNPNSGYYMAFDCLPQKDEVILYKKKLAVSCTGVEFKLEAFFAVLDKNNQAPNEVCVNIEAGGKVLNTATLKSSTNSTWANPGSSITWVPLSTTFKLDDASINSVDFIVKSTNTTSTGYDIAMDDITISVNQPKVTIKTKTYYYKEPAKLTTTYDPNDFDAFFGKNGSDPVTYRWYFSKTGEFNGTESPVFSGSYTSGKDISYTIPSFTKADNNGTYRLIISSSGNESNNLCSIQKDVVVNQVSDEVNVTICQDSTKTILGHTLTPKPGVATESVSFDAGSIVFNITQIEYKQIAAAYIPQCLNSDYPTAGDIELEDIIEKDTNNCPITLQKQYLRVKAGNVADQPKHICEGDTYITNDNVSKIYTEVDETRGTLIEFDDSGCRHEQYVFVHPKKEVTEDVVVCAGDSYDGVPYNKANSTPVKGNSKTFKTIWGCDSLFTPMITVVEPVVVDKGTLTVCPSDGFTFGGKVFNYPLDTTMSTVETGSNGCDSTTKIHLVVMDGGEIHLDTLICREQILFAGTENEEVYNVASPEGKPYQKVIHGTTASGCAMDTIWNVYVVDIILNLRMTGNQHDICQGQPAPLKATLKANDPKGKSLNPTYYWVPEVPQNVMDPTIYLDESTTYTIYADLDLPSDVDKNAKGCHASASWEINVHPIPELTIDSVSAEERSVEYTVTNGTMPYHMYLEAKKDKKQKDDRNKKELGILETNYGKEERLAYGTHILSVQDSTGCTAEQEFKIEAIVPETPTYFTPNNDGIDDYWTIKNLDVYPNCTIKIFDRYGKLLTSGTGADFVGWDGTYNGNKMPATDYWYEINIDEIDMQYYGHFTLMR